MDKPGNRHIQSITTAKAELAKWEPTPKPVPKWIYIPTLHTPSGARFGYWKRTKK